MPNTDTSHLERHRKQWRVTVSVPKAARAKIGKSHLKQSLNTSSLDTANLLKHAIVSRFKAQIELALREVQPEDHFAEARLIRDRSRLLSPKALPVEAFDRDMRPYEIVSDEDSAGIAEDLAEKLMETHGEDYARDFVSTALGRATPIGEHLAAFKADMDYQPKTILDVDRSVTRFSAWLSSIKTAATFEAVTKEVSIKFMRHMIHGEGLSSKSAGKYVTFLRAYWKWVGEQTQTQIDPQAWAAQLPKQRSNGRHTDQEPDDGKRPYTAEELKKLLTGGASDDMMALIKIGALSGMRLEEIYRLRVRDVIDGFFMVRDGKTKNAKRRVPVHSHLTTLVEGLRKGKEAGAYLVDPKAPVIELTGIRSAAASKSFARYRKAVGLDERPNKKLKSNLDFHSLRRWFVAAARDGILKGATGYTMWTIADVVGHGDGLTDTLKMTMGVYAGTSGEDALRACVEAVQLPEGI